jgi:capsular polysaccharide biosynthesis protein
MSKKEKILQGQVYKRTLPVNFEKDDIAYFECEYQLEDVYLHEYTNVNVSYAGTIFSGIKTYKNSIRVGYENKLGLRYVLFNLIGRKKVIAPPEEKFMLIYDNLCGCYYHWMTEALPRLFIIKEKIKEYKIVLPDIYKKFQLASLKPFGIQEKNIFFIPKSSYAYTSNLIMPSYIGIEQSYNDEVMKKIRDFYIGYYKEQNIIKEEAAEGRYYIKRKKTSIRHIINEEEVIICLQKYGFKDIYFEDFSFEQQVNIAYNSKYLVSIHGAGLTNMMFMQKGSKVLEYRKEKETEYLHYYTLASSLDIDYYYLFGSPEDSAVSSKLANLRIDIEKLDRTIIQMIELQ